MVFREIRRFLRRGYLAALLAGIVLMVGFSGAAITFDMIRALVNPPGAGLRNASFVTIARQTPDGGLSRINWYVLEQLHGNLRLPSSTMVAYAPPSHYMLQWRQQTEQVSVAFTQDVFFLKFTRQLYAGRNFTPGVDSGTGEGEAIVSEEFARSLFGNATKALDQNIRISGRQLVIVGVAPMRFKGLWAPTDLWTTPDQWERLASDFRPNVPSPVSWKLADIWYLLATASPDMRPQPAVTFGTQLRTENNKPLHAEVATGLTEDPVRDRNVHASSELGFIVAVALLLSGSLNYCILLFARSSLSIEEFRLKRALGAGSLRLVMDGMYGPLFVVFASFLMSGLTTITLQHLIALKEVNPVTASGLGTCAAIRTLAGEFPLACLLGTSIALVPTLSLLRRSGAPRLGSTTTQTTRERFVLNSIVTLEITVCTLVCLFAGSFIQEYYLLSGVNLGFDPKLLTAYEANRIKGSGTLTIDTSSGRDSPLGAFVRLSMLDAQSQLPGLQSIAAAGCAPFGPPMNTVDVYRFQSGAEPMKGVLFCTVSQNFFSTMRMQIQEGSGFSEADYLGEVNRVVVNRSLAKALSSSRRSVNQAVRLDMPGANLSMDVRVIGIVDDTRQEGALSSPQPTVYLPLTGNAMIMSFPLYFLVRGQQSPKKFREIVERQSESTVPNLGIVKTYPIDEMIRASWQEQSVRLKLALVGAIFVAFIAYAGLYGVLVHSVSVRQKEFALRMIFGASNVTLQRLAVEKTLLCCFVAVGVALSLWKVCCGIIDPQSMSGASWSWISNSIVALVCGLASIAISLIPARRATSLPPATLLRKE